MRRTGILRAAKSSKLVSFLAVIGLIVTSILMLGLFNSAPVSPTRTLQSGRNSPKEALTGTLVVQLLTNQNESDRLSNPTNQLLALGGKAMTVTEADNSSNPLATVLVTDATGRVSQELPPRHYVVDLVDETLSIEIPVQVSIGNETKVEVTIYGAAYPLVYSEESGVIPAAGGAQASMFVELRSSSPIANVSEPVLLRVHGAAPGVGYLVNATVIGQQPPSQGAQWLELGTEGMVDPVNATSIVLTTTWTYSSSITVQPIGGYVSQVA